MRKGQPPWSQLAQATILLAVYGLSSMATIAQSVPAQKKPAPAPVTQETEDIEAVRSELFELLWPTARLTKAIGADPTLLTDEAYVSRNNPELAEFLRNHPEIVRNPEFYLSLPPNFGGKGGHGFEKVDTVWSELHGGFRGPARVGPDEEKILAFLVFVLILAAMLWIFRILLESRKWNRLCKMQNDLYGKLLDKCGTNEELLASFRSATGKPFFDLAAIEPRSANPLTRVFLPLQFGIVLTLAGGGFVSLRPSLASSEHDARIFMSLGILVFTVGLGLMISAAASYLLARHLGLLPKPGSANEPSANSTPSH